MRLRGLLLALLLLPLGSPAQTVGVVLSGGGASAMTHIGVLMALEDHGIPIDCITGSSMGALVGAMYAAGYSPHEIDSLFRTDLFRTMAEGGVEDRYTYFFKHDQPDAAVINVKIDLDTLLQTSLPTNLRSPVLIDFEQMRGFAGAGAASGYDMDSLFVPFRCVASDITAQRPVLFRQGDLAQAVRASMSYPFYFKPIRVDGHLMMDGGLYNNFPSDVMYEEFLPDVIIGSNVASNSAPPTEDDLLSQLKAMLQEPTDYSVRCDYGLIIEPRTNTGLFDFSRIGPTIEEGYAAAMEWMPEIEALIPRRVAQAEVAARRAAFRARWPALRFGGLEVTGLRKGQTRYVERMLTDRDSTIAMRRFKSLYFRLHDDDNIGRLFPIARYVPERGDFDLRVDVRAEKDLHARFGGMFSSRPINTGMVGLRYNLFGRWSSSLQALSWFGKFYAAGQVRLRADLPTAAPIYLEPLFTIHRMDHFRSFATFFDEVRPSFLVLRETWGGLNAGVGLGNKGRLRFDVKYGQTRDSYYQRLDFSPTDTADVTELAHWTGGFIAERNSLNRKQHANAGDQLKFEARYVTGQERTEPGSTNAQRGLVRDQHDWFFLKATLDRYFLPRGVFKFGALVEALYSNYPFFANYTATVMRAPVFQPTPESRTYFLENFRAQQYIAGGVRTIIAVSRNRFDLRLEGYVFQPYRAILRAADDEPEAGLAVSDRAYLASGSLIYQSPVGPIWFNTSYIDGLPEPWAFSLNFGYVIFAQRSWE
ncbi:MAG: patatin-like phospholipase family protein [Flavobacteriales bacterium]|nr:patatin-like phospholipase family protein [Flavobacteriales bacterium]